LLQLTPLPRSMLRTHSRGSIGQISEVTRLLGSPGVRRRTWVQVRRVPESLVEVRRVSGVGGRNPEGSSGKRRRLFGRVRRARRSLGGQRAVRALASVFVHCAPTSPVPWYFTGETFRRAERSRERRTRAARIRGFKVDIQAKETTGKARGFIYTSRRQQEVSRND
jgi:hypothetical protein